MKSGLEIILAAMTGTKTAASENPWRNLPTPKETTNFSAKRIPGVGSAHWGFYWASDWRHRCLLILKHEIGLRSQHRSPVLGSLQIESRLDKEGHQELLVFRLTEIEHRDIFYQFCIDIISSAEMAESGQEALDICIMRTWRWHRLLKRGTEGKLTAEEQKGLIGELAFLTEHVIPAIGVGHAIRSWVGPFGAIRDFELGNVAVECKARGPLASTLRIASVDQLDSTQSVRVFLHVIEIAEVRGEVAGSYSVTEVVNGVRHIIEAGDMAAHGDFDSRLWALGYEHAADYSDRRWVTGETSFFRVVAGFPRVTPQLLPAGVTQVRYSVVLDHCKEFRVEAADVVNCLSGDRDDNKRVR